MDVQPVRSFDIRDVSAWYAKWGTKAADLSPDSGALTVGAVRDALREGAQLVVETIADRFLTVDAGGDTSATSGPFGAEVGSDVETLVNATVLLHELVSSIDGPEAWELGYLTSSIAEHLVRLGVYGAVIADASPRDGYDELVLAQLRSRADSERSMLDRRLNGDGQGPIVGLIQAHVEGAADDAAIARRKVLIEPPAVQMEAWATRMFAVEQRGHDPGQVDGLVVQGRALLSDALGEIHREFSELHDVGTQGGLAGFQTALRRAETIAEQLVLVDVNLPSQFATLRADIRSWTAGLGTEFYEADADKRREMLRAYIPMLGLGRLRTVLADAKPPHVQRNENVGQHPRMPIGRYRKRWGMQPPQLPDRTFTWEELKPYVLAYAESHMENELHCGPELKQRYTEEISWLLDNLGPAVEKVVGRPFDHSEIHLAAATPQEFIAGRCEHWIAQQDGIKTYTAEQARELVEKVAPYVPGARHGFSRELKDWGNEGQEPTYTFTEYICRPATDQYGLVADPNKPRGREEIAMAVVHEWRHNDQFRLAKAHGGDENVDAAFANIPMVEADAVETTRAIILTAASPEFGLLDPERVKKAVVEEAQTYNKWRFADAPTKKATYEVAALYARGLTQNRTITRGLDALSRRAVIEHVLADAATHGQNGDTDQEWGTRLRDALAPDQVDDPSIPTMGPAGGNSRRIWRPGTQVRIPGAGPTRSSP